MTVDMEEISSFLTNNRRVIPPNPIKISGEVLRQNLKDREQGYNCLEMAGTPMKDLPS